MNVSNILCRLYCLSTKAYNEAKCRYPEWGYQNLEWYISTGRASADFLKAVGSLTDRCMITLIQKASCGTANDGVAMAKKYLKLA